MMTIVLKHNELIGTYSVETPVNAKEWRRRYAKGLARVLASDVIGSELVSATVTAQGAHISLDCEDDADHNIENAVRDRWAGRVGVKTEVGI
jgi:hypothetical protein